MPRSLRPGLRGLGREERQACCGRQRRTTSCGGTLLRWRQNRRAPARLLPRGVDRIEAVRALVRLGQRWHVDAVLQCESPGNRAWPLEVGRLKAGVERAEPGEDLLALGVALPIAHLGLALEPRSDLVEQPEDLGVRHGGGVSLLPARRRGARVTRARTP